MVEFKLKKLLKCAETTNFLRMNLNYKKSLNCVNTPTIFISD